jgi:hypothetical protein
MLVLTSLQWTIKSHVGSAIALQETNILCTKMHSLIVVPLEAWYYTLATNQASWDELFKYHHEF